MYQGPKEFAKYLREGYEAYGRLIKELDIKI